MQPIVYEEMKPGEEPAVCALIERVFNEFVAPDFEQEGIDKFCRFANPPAVAERVRSGAFVLVAMQAGELVGVLEFRPPGHLSMMFVTRRRRGVAKGLLASALQKARPENPAISTVTVNSSPYAVPIYQKMGFRQTGSMTTHNGITYVPMELPLETPST